MAASTPPKTVKPVKPAAKPKAEVSKKEKEALAEFMSTGIDFSPFTIDAGDGVEWGFHPDPMPYQSARVADGMSALKLAAESGEGVEAVFTDLIAAIRDLIIDDKQREEFPKPLYGTNAIMFFAVHIATGRSGFPTESD